MPWQSLNFVEKSIIAMFLDLAHLQNCHYIWEFNTFYDEDGMQKPFLLCLPKRSVIGVIIAQITSMFAESMTIQHISGPWLDLKHKICFDHKVIV